MEKIQGNMRIGIICLYENIGTHLFTRSPVTFIPHYIIPGKRCTDILLLLQEGTSGTSGNGKSACSRGPWLWLFRQQHKVLANCEGATPGWSRKNLCRDSEFPYFEALTSTRWVQDGDGYDLPSWPEFHSMEVVMELIKFSNSKVEEYSFPEDHRRAFSLLRLADLVGVDSFVALMAEKLDVPVARITNTNPIRDVRRCIRDRYRVSKHHGGEHRGCVGNAASPLPLVHQRRL